jgi:hypothetical protein
MPTYCTECGTRREGDEAFCTNCATRYDDAVRAERPDETGAPEEPAGHGAGWYVGLSVALAVILIGAVVGGGTLLRNRVSSADVTDAPITGVRLNSDGFIVTGEPGSEESTPAVEEPSSSEEPSYTEEPQYTPEPTPTYTEETLTPTTAPPDLGNATVSVAPEVTNNATARAVVALLTGYFTAINEQDYSKYRQVLTRGARQTQAEFEKGYRTTNNSQVLLRELGIGEDGRLLATVDFVSTQDAADGPEGQTCTRWTVGKFFEKEGSKLRIAKALKGHSSHLAC